MSGIVRNYDEPELMRLRDHLLKGGEIFSATNPGIPLVHIGKTKSERKRSRKKPKKAPSSKMRKLK